MAKDWKEPMKYRRQLFMPQLKNVVYLLLLYLIAKSVLLCKRKVTNQA